MPVACFPLLLHSSVECVFLMRIFKKNEWLFFGSNNRIIITLEINKIFKLKDMFWLCSFLLFPKACIRIGFDYWLHSILSIYKELQFYLIQQTPTPAPNSD